MGLGKTKRKSLFVLPYLLIRPVCGYRCISLHIAAYRGLKSTEPSAEQHYLFFVRTSSLLLPYSPLPFPPSLPLLTLHQPIRKEPRRPALVLTYLHTHIPLLKAWKISSMSQPNRGDYSSFRTRSLGISCHVDHLTI